MACYRSCNSIQSSIQRQLGLVGDNRQIAPREQGVAEMMVDLYRTFSAPLSKAKLFSWHKMLMTGRHDIKDVGRYRTDAEPMQIISGAMGTPKNHFEAPPSNKLPREMDGFIEWFNSTAPGGSRPLPAVTRAGAAHLYFESIHPLEDGNGRIGRAIAEKSLAQSLGQPTLIVLAATILAQRARYYDALEAANKGTEITEWLAWFAGITLEAQRRTLELTEFLIEKTKLLDRLEGQLNDRQKKTLLRMFKEGPEGFKGGLSAGNYGTFTGASPATTTRDLVDLTEKGVLLRIGELRHARYRLATHSKPVDLIVVEEDGTLVETN